MNATARARLTTASLWLPFLLLTCGPVLYLVARSFFPSGGSFSSAAYVSILTDRARLATLWNSLELGLLTVAATVVVGVPFGFLVSRTDLAGRRIYEACAIAPMLVPPYITGIAWVQLLPLHGLPAIVFILGSSLFPVVALLSARAFREIGRDLEDASRLAVGDRRGFLGVTLPLARPGIVAAALLVFVYAISDFVVADFFSFAGKGEGTFQVFATEVYGAFVRQTDPIAATATAVPLVIVAAAVLWLLARLEAARSTASVVGSHVEPRPFVLGRLKVAAHLFVGLVLVVTAVAPAALLGRLALRGGAPPPPAEPAANAVAPLGQVDLSIYRDKNPVATAIRRYGPDLAPSVAGAAVAVAILLLAAFGPARALALRPAAGTLPRLLVLLPLAFPSLLVGMAWEQGFHQLAATGSTTASRIYFGFLPVSCSLASRFLPLAVLGLRSSWLRLAPQIEESARLVPVAPALRWGRITLPLLLPGLLAVAVLTFALSLREFDAIVLLQGAQTMLTHRVYALVHYGEDAVVGTLCLLQMAAILVPWVAGRLLLGGRRR